MNQEFEDIKNYIVKMVIKQAEKDRCLIYQSAPKLMRIEQVKKEGFRG